MPLKWRFLLTWYRYFEIFFHTKPVYNMLHKCCNDVKKSASERKCIKKLHSALVCRYKVVFLASKLNE